ncbi:hypothetical protein [Cellulomonas palmilytica]|uniref:hypothetical protein n=1 Tax=Cellulomonas palmilytica TaxID=2608402 RepID=UPI001F2FE487|nr:hypothetical protein [Cellulomonas palmilytica]UJP39332.1 hypothetical protein F1D97_13440 [Cellulomonas palmilytica]
MAGKKIRDDLEGVTFVYVNDLPVALRAGDDVPKGAKVGDHLLADGKTSKASGEQKPAEPTTPTDPPADDTPAGPEPEAQDAGTASTPPDGRSSRDAWLAWAKEQGVDVADDAPKDDIRAAVAAATQQQ